MRLPVEIIVVDATGLAVNVGVAFHAEDDMDPYTSTITLVTELIKLAAALTTLIVTIWAARWATRRRDDR